MLGYELRVITTAGRTVQNPDRTELFTAPDDVAAIDHMNNYASGLDTSAGVWLVPSGTDLSIASADGAR